MQENMKNESMLDMYIFETTQMIEQLEQLVMDGEKNGSFSTSINEIFRIMHTIKGSSAMMLYNNIAELSHAVEDLFCFLRERKPGNVDYKLLSDMMLEAIDFIKNELSKIESGNHADGDDTASIKTIKTYLGDLKGSNGEADTKSIKPHDFSDQPSRYFVSEVRKMDTSQKHSFEAVIFFNEGCEMENIRAFMIIHRLAEVAEIITHIPENIVEDDGSAIQMIQNRGFKVRFLSSLDKSALHEILEETAFVEKLEIHEFIDLESGPPAHQTVLSPPVSEEGKAVKSPQNQNLISVNITKTDRLMDLIGELVIAEAMVTQNRDIQVEEQGNFQKSARLLRKIVGELQDVVMSIRKVPLFATFQKMHRLVRDMGKKVGKQVELIVIGEDTEVDKNIIDHISDPLMHLVRNAIDHGIEAAEDRIAGGKPAAGTVTLEARNAGSDVLVMVKDDGRGLDKQKILERAKEKGLLPKPEGEMTDKEIFNLIFIPGFSTNDNITEFSGRGVGMDVVIKNIETIGGTVTIESTLGAGSAIIIKIPLTLAIIDGMNVGVGNARYTIPTISIQESFRPKEKDIIYDPGGNEMIMVRGRCYPILRLHEQYQVKTEITQFHKGILIMVEHNEKSLCIFADELLGQQQVVVKSLPGYIRSTYKVRGLGGCTILGDGSISLILDIEGFVTKH